MKTRTRSSSAAPADDAVVVQSDDGSVRISMRLTRLGLWVRRERRRDREHAWLVQSVVFSETNRFERWCDSDTIRFDYPIVSQTVRRRGGALLDEHEHKVDAEPDRPQP